MTSVCPVVFLITPADFSEYALLRVLLVACLDNCLVDLTHSKQRFLKHNKDSFTSPQSVALVTNTSLFKPLLKIQHAHVITTPGNSRAHQNELAHKRMK